MSAIEASSVKVATMADGTLRITCDIEPRHAQAAFALFGSPGTPMALAALRLNAAAQTPQSASLGSDDLPCTTSDAAAPIKPKGGALAKLAGMWCADPVFQQWLTAAGDFSKPLNCDTAAEVIRSWCCVLSRAELDSAPHAEELFQRHIRGPYMKYMQAVAA